MINLNGLKIDNLDEIMVIDRNFNIVYYTRIDTKINNEVSDQESLIGKNVFEAYPSVQKESSGFTLAMTRGEPVTKINQKFVDYAEKVYCTHNLTMPIIKKGEIVGAVELSKDITTIKNVKETHEDDFSTVIQKIVYETEKNQNITFDQIYTVNGEMKDTVERAKILSRSPTPTLIYGETGTGKELFAQAMINYSGIDRHKVVIQNCASVPDTLIESTLFGTIKGAYTGAENHKGLFDQANGGIFFMDELNSLPYHVQGKLLRVIQEGTFRPIGSNQEKRVNVKILAAMNVDPEDAMKKNLLRRDLFYRLSAGTLHLLPLRERKEDIGFLLSYFITESNAIYEKQVQGMTKGLRQFLYSYPWYGNVRELKNLVQLMVSLSKQGTLNINELPAYMYNKVKKDTLPDDSLDDEVITIEEKKIKMGTSQFSLSEELQRIEKRMIEETLKKTKGNKTKASFLLGIPRQTLTYKIAKMHIHLPTI